MSVLRALYLSLLVALLAAAPAAADDVLVMGKDGRVRTRDDQFVKRTQMKMPRPPRGHAVAGIAADRKSVV